MRPPHDAGPHASVTPGTGDAMTAQMEWAVPAIVLVAVLLDARMSRRWRYATAALRTLLRNPRR